MTAAKPMPPANMAGTVTNEVVANRAIPDRPCPLEGGHKRQHISLLYSPASYSYILNSSTIHCRGRPLHYSSLFVPFCHSPPFVTWCTRRQVVIRTASMLRQQGTSKQLHYWYCHPRKRRGRRTGQLPKQLLANRQPGT